MIATGYNAWQHDETIRQWFEVVFDVTSAPAEHTGYVCKCCWQQFKAKIDIMVLLGHAQSHESQVEPLYSLPRPSPITGEEVLGLYRSLSEYFDVVTPEIGAWKFRCKSCKTLLLHRSAHRELLEHARLCAGPTSPYAKTPVSDPSYISQQMFDRALQERFLANPDDEGVRRQGSALMHLVTTSKFRDQILTDVLYAARAAGYSRTEQTAVVAFCMGVQFGFELACTYPPLSRK